MMNNTAAVTHQTRPRLAPWLWLLFAVILYTPLIDTEVGQGNVASDLAAIESLVHRHTFFINDSPFSDTHDKLKRGDLFFSQKSPIFHLVAAVPYRALTLAGKSLTQDPALCVRVLTFFMTILPMGWLLGLLYDHPWLRQRSRRVRLGLTLLFALGSLQTPFAITLNHYTLASACLLAAVNRLTVFPWDAAASIRRRAALAIGFWISASLACDVPPAFIFGLGLAAAWTWRAARHWRGERQRPARAAVWLTLGAAPLLLLYAALNQHIVGSPLPPNLHEEQMLYYPGSYWAELRAHPGYYQASYARRLWHVALGHKGIYWMMPLLLLATAGAVRLARRRAPGWPLALAWAAFPPAVLAVTMRWAADLGGGAYLIRHVLAALAPLYAVLGHPALARPGRTARVALGAAGLWGVVIAAVGLLNPWSHNTLSALPPLENAARLCLAHPRQLPTEWIAPLIEATSVTPDNGWLDLGLTYLGQGRPHPAELALRRAVAARPSLALPYYHLGIALDLEGHPAEAIAAYRTLLTLEPENLGGWNNLGLFALKAGDLGQARAAYERSQTLAPGNASADWGLLLLEQMAGTLTPDSSRLREALARHPSDPRFQALAGELGLVPQPAQ